MKKVFSIFLLTAAMIWGVLSIEAKTTSKSSSSKSLSVTDLLNKTRGGFDGFKSDAQIESALKRAGFALNSKTVKNAMIDDGTEGDEVPGKLIDYKFSKNGTVVEWTSYSYDEAPKNVFKNSISIKFKDSSAKNSFIKSMRANGYTNGGNEYNDDAYVILIKVKGLNIILYGNWE